MKKTILIVEGHEVDRLLKERALQAAGYETRWTDASSVAMRKLQQEDYDLAILSLGDIRAEPNGPVLREEGLELLRAIRADLRLSKARLPIIAVTSFLPANDVSYEKIAVEAGADAFFEELVELDQLVGTVRRLLEHREEKPRGRTPDAKEIASALRTDISRILKWAPAELIGRDDELKLLNEAWLKVRRPESPHPHVLTFVALGGEGKTSLVVKWAAELAGQDWPGCDAAFAWSFYSQGTREQQVASSDLFLKEALTFFGDDADKQFAASNAGAFEKGQRLARLVGQRRSLLILDGLEPLQYAPTAPTPGELKDQGVAALLKGLAAASHGLCVVTTRYSLPDLKAFWQTTAPEVKLLRLSRDAGVHLLKTLGVRGTAQEFATLVEDVKGHALTLTLLGGFLKRAFHGDIRQRDRVKFEKADEKMDGGHAFRTMAAYEQWLLRDGGDEGRREVAVLRLMGLFDRPMMADQVDELLKPPAISGVTESLIDTDEAKRETALARLEAARLLIMNRGASGEFVAIDSHPLVRAYFSAQLRKDNPNGFQEGLSRLEAYRSQLEQRATPLRLCFESERFTAAEIAEILGYFSDYYEAIAGDRLVIESHGTLETSGVLVPQGA